MKIVITVTILVLSEIISHTQGITVGPVGDNYHGYYNEFSTRSPAFDQPFYTSIKKPNPISGARVSISKIKPVVFQSNNFRRTRGGRKYGQPFQLDLKQRNYQEQQAFLRRKQPYHYYSGTFPLKPSPYPTDSKGYKYPEMKKNHQALREQVDVLKQQQKIFFTDEDDERPASRVESSAEFVANKLPYTNQDIFANEQIFFDKQKDEFEAIRQKHTEPSPSSKLEVLDSDEVDGKYRPELYESDSDFNAGFSYRKMPVVLHKLQNDGDTFGFLNGGRGVQKSPYKYENYHELDDSGEEIEDSDGEDTFIPVQRYTQVRKSETLAVEPSIPIVDLEKRPKSRLKSEKSHTLYTEQGYEDSEYDHGGEDKFGKIEINKKPKRLRRSVEPSTVDDSTEIESLEELPISLPLTKVRNLKGDELIEYITELLKNSTVYAPDEDNRDNFNRNHDADHEAVLKEQSAIRKSIKENDKSNSDSEESSSTNTERYVVPDKYPYYNLPTEVLHEMSALRYAQNIPKYSSYYETKSNVDCDKFDPQIDNMPKQIPKGDYNENHAKNQRLGQLGDRINCLKSKYFGQHPLDNPIFKEQYVQSNLNPFERNPDIYNVDSAYQATSTRPVSTKNLIKKHQNPAINVYDDVVSNIRMAVKRNNHKSAPGQKDEVIYWKYIPPTAMAAVKIPEHVQSANTKIDIGADNTYIAIFKKKNLKKKNKPTETPIPENSASHSNYQYTTSGEQETPNSNIFDVTQYLPKVFMIKSDGKIYAVNYKDKSKKSNDHTVFPMQEVVQATEAYLRDSEEFDWDDNLESNESLAFEKPPPLPATSPSVQRGPSSQSQNHQRFAYPLRRPYIVAAPSYTYPKRVKVYERVILV